MPESATVELVRMALTQAIRDFFSSPRAHVKLRFIKAQQARVLPCRGPLVTVAILAQGTNWAVAVTQAFFENGQRLSVILHD